MTEELISLFPLWYVAFLLSLTCHEAAHALVAKWGGDLTAYNSGQVSLSPLPHIQREPFGTVLVPILSFLLSGWMLGWGSAPYDPLWEQRHPKRAALMALAGPAANFLLVFLAVLLVQGGTSLGVFQAPGGLGFTRIVDATSSSTEGLARFVSILFSLNLLLGTFNLLPVPPLDGHSAVGLVLPEDLFRRWLELVRSPMFSLLGLVIAWRYFDVLFTPVFFFALRLL